MRIRLVLLGLAMLLGLPACGDKSYITVQPTVIVNTDTTKKDTVKVDTTTHVAVTGIQIVPSSITLCYGTTGATNTSVVLSAIISPSNATNQGFKFTVPQNGPVTLNGNVLTSSGIGTGTATTIALGDSSKMSTAFVTVTSCAPPAVTTSIAVTPRQLDLYIGQIGSLTATVTVSSGATPTPTWTSTLGCVQLSATTGNSVSVTATRACRDSVVAMANGEKAFSIVTVTSGLTAIDYTPSGGTIALGSTVNLTAICTIAGVMVCTPYWYSSDPSRVQVLGAPSVIVINGVPYPAGPTATIKAVWHGTATVCVQATLQDKTVKKCYDWFVP